MAYEGISKENTRLTWTIDKSIDTLKRTASLTPKNQIHNLMNEVDRLEVELRDEGQDLTNGEVLALVLIRAVQIIDETERRMRLR